MPVAARDDRLILDSLRLRISGVIFAHWSYDTAQANPEGPGTNGANRFDLTRTYINIEPQVSRNISLRITPDITRVSDPDGSLNGSLALRLKYAYAQFADVLPDVRVKGGLQQTAYIDFEDSIWKYRVLGPAALELFTGVSSADLGVGAWGKHLGGLVDYQVLLSGGDGYTKGPQTARNAAKYKEGAARLTIAPFATSGGYLLEGLRLTAFAQYAIRQKVADKDVERIRVMGLASWETPYGTLAVSAGPTWDDDVGENALGEATVTNRKGVLASTFGFVNLPANLRLVGRYDHFTPNTDEEARAETSGNRTRLIAGLAYRVTDLVQVIGDYQRFGFEHPEKTGPKDPSSAVFVHLDARY
ncbi:hypothetical protein AKJ08_2464 [Vulgatibacter incomptus]|uniref:Porin n=2 Tax=Vulgatibacter incomptus TaxID=1391653 RepID=A0A0K1PEZ4_9BACT|nr:hypothetical protein AKJ08_2464 [Vulgatibacter incomptus]